MATRDQNYSSPFFNQAGQNFGNLSASKIAAAELRGYQRGIEDAARVCDERAEYYHQRSVDAQDANLSCEREYGSEACANAAHRIRALSKPESK